ncbi:MAG TPA: cytochrome c3 family protein [Candidatus Methylomirabilis sp.]|nr:cytochrome c3 family protein [Candidatus Methylomirabilis sp.]HSC70695.1 cytochrome c3 family protein [Candidatus Methylomirabilis sp.]
MRRKCSLFWGLILAVALLGEIASADSRLKGWVTQVDPAARTVQVSGQTIPTEGMRVTGGPLEPGAFVSVDRGRIKVKRQRPPAEDQIIRFPVKGPENPGRSQFSHLRHFNALGEKQCKTCHSPEMGLLTSPSYASRVSDAALEPHDPKSLGRYCGTCHNGTTRLSQVGDLGNRRDALVFTTAKTGNLRSCQRCHAPADHGPDFTPAHGDIAEHRGAQSCFTCHAQAWGPADRQRHAALLTAEQTLKANPDDPKAALAVGPNNFCVYCHRRDSEWQGED